jgi:flagellar export protein FliJ
MERETLREMAELQRRREGILQDLCRLRGRLQKVGAQWTSLESSEVKVEDLRRLQWVMTSLRGEIRVLNQSLVECESHLQEVRSIWLRRRRDRRILELLKERQREEFIRSLVRAETRHLDEIALRPFATSAMGGTPCPETKDVDAPPS